MKEYSIRLCTEMVFFLSLCEVKIEYVQNNPIVFAKWLRRRMYRPKWEETAGCWKTQFCFIEPCEESLLF